MGNDFNRIPVEKIEKDIVSPANSVNTSLFNKPHDYTLGLEKSFFNFINEKRPDLLEFYAKRWNLKLSNKKTAKMASNNETLLKSESGIVIEYKIWSYSLILPNIE